jgi:hypothetical protein
MTAVVWDHQIITIFWSSAKDIGLDEPDGAMAVELEDDDYPLIEHLNAVAYPTGYWKITDWIITDWRRGEGPLIIGGQESDLDAAKTRVEAALHEIWRNDGEIE